MNYLEEVGGRVKNFRKSKDYTQAEFADMAGVGTQTQIFYEKGKRELKVSYLKKISDFGCDINFAVLGKEQSLDKQEGKKLISSGLTTRIYPIVEEAKNNLSDSTAFPDDETLSLTYKFLFDLTEEIENGNLRVETIEKLFYLLE